MKLNGYEDLRVQRTISNIYAAFETLICEKDYRKITVTELAKLAQINKKTFYRYYPTLDDLLSEMQTQYTKAYLEKIKDFQYPRDLGQSIEAFFTFSAQQGEAYDRITLSSVGSYAGIRQQMIDRVMNATWGQSKAFNFLESWKKQLLLEFVEKTGLNAYNRWVENGKQAPIEEVIELTTALLEGGVNTFLKLNS
ncbi:TetR family transcriptional regulator [Lactobacillus curvatus]|nr:TetR family transcriptional regulator [Latilactobacillus curvatus]MSE24362.1 TetR family transcriptional regulator [Latilactobacillus curvatus]